MNEASPILIDAPASVEPAFIPISRDDVIRELSSEKLWTNPDERASVALVLKLIGLLRQHQSAETLNRLVDLYDPFNPDDETVNLVEATEMERLRGMGYTLAGLDGEAEAIAQLFGLRAGQLGQLDSDDHRVIGVSKQKLIIGFKGRFELVLGINRDHLAMAAKARAVGRTQVANHPARAIEIDGKMVAAKVVIGQYERVSVATPYRDRVVLELVDLAT